ncbi:paired small multidrug resistance pump [Virgibacillus halotolerans]|uniref:DMT family transporter n=1 Tax=Virgibacillus halotolerans TaxID=1071053 RepID=UPI00196180DA|nr:SMR family transporter [Virgibacillus halotolerans]MBM7598994.1 paired small multidrug resistance pump [Virgibacillus halotolerans]
MNRAWIYVFLTSLFELIWLYGFNIAHTWWHWIFILILIYFDLQCLAKACQGLPTGTVYAVFAAAGTIGTVLMDTYLFHVDITLIKLLFIGIILIGVIGLNLSDHNSKKDDRKSRKWMGVN